MEWNSDHFFGGDSNAGGRKTNPEFFMGASRAGFIYYFIDERGKNL